MFCQNCAKELDPNATVCVACGTPVTRPNTGPDVMSSQPTSTPPASLKPVSATKRFSPAVFGFALVCFLLPFVTVSCNQQTVASFTGLQLVFGTTVQQPQMFGPPKVQKVNGDPFAIVAFVCCAIALGLSFAAARKAEIAASALSAVSFLVLLSMKSRFDDQVRQRSSGFLQVNYEVGFWLLIGSTVVATALSAFAPWRSRGS